MVYRTPLSASGTDAVIDVQAGAPTQSAPKALQQVAGTTPELKAAVADTHNPARALLREAEEARLADGGSQPTQLRPQAIDFVSKGEFKVPE